MLDLLNQFALNGDLVSSKPFGNGHINKTFLVETTKERYIFQFVNASVFPDVDVLMNNIYLVTEHLRKKGVRSLEIVPTKDGRLFVRQGDDFFRGYKYIEDSVCYEALPTLEMVQEAARGFGEFHQALSDIDVSQIKDVIPDFHHTAKRYEFFRGIVEKDPKGRLASCKEDVDFLKEQEPMYSLLVDALEKGTIRPSITHNDPKINNVAFTKDTGKVACILDLDTVMTGTFLYDVGDGLRSLFTGDNEDNEDTSKLIVDLKVYEAYLEGYLESMAKGMTPKEVELLPYSVLVISLELAMRFLGDYINGDVYFGVAYPTHNLVRARTQIALAKDIIRHLDEMKEITEKVYRRHA